MKNMIFAFALSLAIACQEKPAENTSAALADATDLAVEQLDQRSEERRVGKEC